MPTPESSLPTPAWNSGPGLAFGGDYNPEQWPVDVRLEDIGLMKEAGVTLLSVGIFSWALLEPREGEYDFGWLDEVLDNLDGAGIKVALATATAAPPAWLVGKHPEVLPVMAEGTVLERGSRRHYSPSSAVYRRYAAGITRVSPTGTRTTRRWRCGMWTTSWAATFRSFTAMKTPRRSGPGWSARYGSIEALNAGLGHSLWSQHYASFEEIIPPRAAPPPSTPAQRLDFQRFSSWALMDYYRSLLAVHSGSDAGCPGHHQPHGFQRHQIHGLLRLGEGPGRDRERPLPGGRRPGAGDRTGVQR